jgi:hypothetical protein
MAVIISSQALNQWRKLKELLRNCIGMELTIYCTLMNKGACKFFACKSMRPFK